jgi:hypothetical protein
VLIDTVAPTTTDNAPAWSNTGVEVNLTGSDAGSGIDKTYNKVDGGPWQLGDDADIPAPADHSNDGPHTISYYSVDRAGNTEATRTATVRIDTTPPTITATPDAAPNTAGWYKAPVRVHFSCADPGSVASGIASCSDDQVLADRQSAAGTATDRAGNSATAGFGPVNVDAQAPQITLNGISDHGVYTLGAVPTASCTAVDAGRSGLDGNGCRVSVTGGQPNGVGTFTFTATAGDIAGNRATVTGTYGVHYLVANGTAFWLQPINDTAHMLNATTSVFKAGSTVPAKFRLTDASGKPVQANATPVWLTPVKGSATTAAVDESVYSDAATSGSAFTWSAADQTYQYNWATAKTGAGYYWRIGVALDDGTQQLINIGLR